jgi:GNAT superfamily N-acetyltransferase
MSMIVPAETPDMKTLRLIDPHGGVHLLEVQLATRPRGDQVRMEMAVAYAEGGLVATGTRVAFWSVTWEGPAGSDLGHVAIGDGRIDIEVEALRGIGLGSLIMGVLITCVQALPSLDVCPIDLSAEDAATPQARDRRNQFYEKLGFRFRYYDDKTWGHSLSIKSHQLIPPPFTLRPGWRVECASSSEPA